MLMPWLMEFCPEFFSLQKIPTISLNVSANFFCQHMTGWYPKVPASKVEALRRGAMEDLGHLNLAVETKSSDSGWKKHAQRNAWRTFRRYGIGWKVPLSVFHFTGSEGEVLEIPYIAPKDILQFLLKQHPDILFGEVRSGPGYALQLKEFWAAYQQQHEGHQIFDSESGLDTAYTLPLLVHGDEGRGKRRTNTFILSLETRRTTFFSFLQKEKTSWSKWLCPTPETFGKIQTGEECGAANLVQIGAWDEDEH